MTMLSNAVASLQDMERILWLQNVKCAHLQDHGTHWSG